MSEATGGWPDTIPGAAQHAAACWPHEIALIVGSRRWTFAELWADARAVASAMLASGIGHADRIAIWAPNTREWILAALGSQAIGATIVPMNTRFKGGEASDILRRAQVKLIFAPADFLGQDYAALVKGADLPALVETIHIDRDFERFVARGKGADDPKVLAALARLTTNDISDIIFTSGTTGRPKGALSAHGQVTRMFGDWSVRVDLRAGDRYLVVNPFFHTFGYKAGWVACLLRGAAIVPMRTFDVSEMISQIETNRISFIPGPPTIYQSLLHEQTGAARRDFSSLRVAVTGAAPVPPALVERMRLELGMSNIVNGYGMTECGCISMTRQGDESETIATSCGLPLPGIEVRCVGDDETDMPLDKTGELLVRGYGVMRGYLDDPEATAAAIDADGWLHTGDIGSIDGNGYLRITDRKKDMFISGGFNCYPAEIEKLLSEHPAVGMVAVIGVSDARLGEVGKAFVVARSGASLTASELATWAKANMANYKVPRQFVLTSHLPKNAAGKVVKTELS